jgi:methyl-accepting chemotaxis protein
MVLLTLSLSIIFFNGLNKVVNKNIDLFHNSIIDIKKEELINKMDLATHIIELYYKNSLPIYMKAVVEKDLKTQSEQLFSQLNNIYKQYKNILPQKELKQLLISIVKNARYGKNGYFWINDFNYKMVMHPIKPEYDGKIFINTPKVPFVELAVNALKNKDESFIRYKFYNPATKKYEYKVSLVKVFKPYNWIIGTGKYLSDITQNVQQKVLNDLKHLRYGKNGYFWVNDINYKMIMHPIKPEYNGKYFKNDKKVPFVQLGVDKLLKTHKNQVFIEYEFYNPATKKYEKKLSIVRLFKPWGWVIGTGTYLNDIQKTNEKVKLAYKNIEYDLAKKAIVSSLIILIIAILVAYYFTVFWIVNPMKELDHTAHYFEEIAYIDHLTKIDNRRSFFEKSAKIIELARRNKLDVGMLMIDIDFFKRINDTYGHKAGDEVLKAVSQAISEVIRESDLLGRIGGEEFALLVVNCNKENLEKVAQKVRKAVEDVIVEYKEAKINITISVGAYLANDEDDIDEMLKKADELLYKAKENGRNRVEVSE